MRFHPPDFRTHIAHACIRHITHVLAQRAVDRGPAYLHMSTEEGEGRVLLKFLTDLIYCDMILLSGVISAIGKK